MMGRRRGAQRGTDREPATPLPTCRSLQAVATALSAEAASVKLDFGPISLRR